MKQKSIKVNAILNIIKTAMSMIFPLITFPYSSRVLLPEGIGKVNFANSIVSYFSLIAAMGIGTYALRECAKVRDDKTAFSQVVKDVLFINLISTLIAYILLFSSLFFVPKFFEYRKLLCIISTNILFVTLGMDWLYGSLEDYVYITIRSIAFQFLSLILLFVFVHTPDDYLKYAGISVIATSGSGLLNFIHSRKYISFKGTERPHVKKHIGGILIFFAFNLAASIFTILDTSMLGFLSTPEQVGFYATASKLIRMLRDLFPAAFTVLTARFAYYVAQNNKSEIFTISKRTMNFILCFAIPISLGVILLIDPLVKLLFGENFIPSISVTRIMAPLIFFSGCSGFLGGVVLFSQGKDKIYLARTIIASVSDLILNFIFIPKHGAFGAALATTITEGLILVIDICFLFTFIKELHVAKNLVQFSLAAVFMGIVIIVCCHFLSTNILKLFVSFFCGVFVYALSLFVFRNDFFLGILQYIKNKFVRK